MLQEGLTGTYCIPTENISLIMKNHFMNFTDTQKPLYSAISFFFYLMGILSKHYHSMKKTVSLSIKKKIIQFLKKNKPNIANSIED